MGRESLIALLLLGLLGLAAALGPRMLTGASSRDLPQAAPRELVRVARQAASVTNVDPRVLLAVSEVECDYGRCRSGQPDSLVPADVRSHVDASALRAGGSTAVMLGLRNGRRIGDWVNPHAVAGGQHAMGFMQFLPSTWREQAARAPGGASDPYRPYDSMVVAGSYLTRLENGAEDGRRRDLHAALAVYGGSAGYADQVIRLAGTLS